MHHHPLHHPSRAHRGFTLIEVMIAVAIVAILASMAYPAYQDSIRKGRRSEAFTALSAVQQAQERWRSNNASYAALLNTATSGSPPNGLGLSETTAQGLYTLSVSGLSSTGYTVTAVAVTGKSQASDGNCKALGVRMSGGNIAYGSGATSAAIDWADPSRCWAR